MMAILIVAVAAGAYAGDMLMFRIRSAPYGSVTVRVYYAIQEKNSRTEYMYKNSEQQTCVRSLFPHSGVTPCWYLRRSGGRDLM